MVSIRVASPESRARISLTDHDRSPRIATNTSGLHPALKRRALQDARGALETIRCKRCRHETVRCRHGRVQLLGVGGIAQELP